MGNCGSSNEKKAAPFLEPYNNGHNSPLTEEEIQRRKNEGITSVKRIKVKGVDRSGRGYYDLKYAYVSQKGYYPSGTYHKNNIN